MDSFLSSWNGTYGPNGDTVSFIAKEEVKELPLVGTISKTYQTIFVKREIKSDRGATIRAIKARCDAINEGKNFGKIQIFPEGTRSNGSYLIK
jgi:1-acyl-sn-glycerol-3-phosphate acyltransferase